jgi:hypothetical protein
VCKCKHGILECLNTCEQDSLLGGESDDPTDMAKQSGGSSMTLRDRQSRLHQHHRHHRIRNSEPSSGSIDSNTPAAAAAAAEIVQLRTACYHNEQIRPFNTTWSPLRCTQCHCGFNSQVECYVAACPPLDCPNVRFFSVN